MRTSGSAARQRQYSILRIGLLHDALEEAFRVLVEFAVKILEMQAQALRYYSSRLPQVPMVFGLLHVGPTPSCKRRSGIPKPPMPDSGTARK